MTCEISEVVVLTCRGLILCGDFDDGAGGSGGEFGIEGGAGADADDDVGFDRWRSRRR